MRKTFLYDFNSKSWKKVAADPFANVEIETVPVCLIVNDEVEFGTPSEGMLAPVDVDRDKFFTTKNEKVFASFRWWIDSSESKPGNYRLAGNFVKILGIPETREFQHYRQRLTANLEIAFDDGKAIRRPPDDPFPEIPPEIAQEIFDSLMDHAEKFFGFEPAVSQFAVDNSSDNWDMLIRFVERPLDMNLTYLEKFLPGKFDANFPRGAQDNFEKVCELLEIDAADNLKNKYFDNPFVLVIQKIMTQFGMKNSESIELFFDCNIEDFFSHDLKNSNGFPSNLPDDMQKEFFEWLSSEIGELEAAKIFREACDIWNDIHTDTLQLWEAVIGTDLLDNLREYFIAGFSEENRNMIASVLIRQKISKGSTFFYSQHERSYQTRVDEYEFKLPYNVDDFFDICNGLKIQARDYVRLILSRETALIAIKNGDEYAGFVEYHDGKILQAKALKNKALSRNMKKMIQNWAKDHDLQIKTKDLF